MRLAFRVKGMFRAKMLRLKRLGLAQGFWKDLYRRRRYHGIREQARH